MMSRELQAAPWLTRKPNYPNPAFQNATHRDLYWGAKIVMSFTDEITDQVVHEARYSRREDASTWRASCASAATRSGASGLRR